MNALLRVFSVFFLGSVAVFACGGEDKASAEDSFDADGGISDLFNPLGEKASGKTTMRGMNPEAGFGEKQKAAVLGAIGEPCYEPDYRGCNKDRGITLVCKESSNGYVWMLYEDCGDMRICIADTKGGRKESAECYPRGAFCAPNEECIIKRYHACNAESKKQCEDFEGTYAWESPFTSSDSCEVEVEVDEGPLEAEGEEYGKEVCWFQTMTTQVCTDYDSLYDVWFWPESDNFQNDDGGNSRCGSLGDPEYTSTEGEGWEGEEEEWEGTEGTEGEEEEFVCFEGQIGLEDGTCCTPYCGSTQCGGDNGCGGECGVDTPTGMTCDASQKCDESGFNCVECVPDCSGKCAGEDGCGGICTVHTPAGLICEDRLERCDGTTLTCQPTSCIVTGLCKEGRGACPGSYDMCTTGGECQPVPCEADEECRFLSDCDPIRFRRNYFCDLSVNLCHSD